VNSASAPKNPPNALALTADLRHSWPPRRDSAPKTAFGRWLAQLDRVNLWSWALLLTVLTLVLITDLRSPEKDDVAWLLYVARKWLAGQRLYDDLVEVNPPLIVWMYAAPAWIAGMLSVPPKLVAVPSFAILVLGMAWWTANIVHRRAPIFAHRTPIFAIAAR
jgi:hypothetical protein